MRLKVSSLLESESNLLYFNSTLVRLKAAAVFYIAIRRIFQFNSCAIKGTIDNAIFALQRDFNSTLVRLKAALVMFAWWLCLFQFNSCAIKGIFERRILFVPSIFQFNSCAIKGSFLCCHFAFFFNFNSTLVRLKAF